MADLPITLIKNTSFAISREIDVVAVVDLVVTVLFGLYLTRILGKRDEQERAEKDTLIADVKDFKEIFISDVRELIEPDAVSYTMAVSVLKSHRQSINSICDCAERYKFLTDAALKAKIKGKVKMICDLFTNTVPDGDGTEPGITISDGKIIIPQLRDTKIQGTLTELSRLLFDLVVHINRS